MIQLRANRPIGVFGNLALQDLTGAVRVRKQAPKNRSAHRTARHWELPNPFTVKVERILQRSIWAYVGLVVVITIVRNVAR